MALLFDISASEFIPEIAKVIIVVRVLRRTRTRSLWSFLTTKQIQIGDGISKKKQPKKTKKNDALKT